MRTRSMTGALSTAALLVAAAWPTQAGALEGGTLQALEAVIQREVNARAMYVDFAEAARVEGLAWTARTFLAIAFAESIHARNAERLLEQKYPDVPHRIAKERSDSVEVRSTADNLVLSRENEVREFTTIYPVIKQLLREGSEIDGLFSCIWGQSAEKTHSDRFLEELLDLSTPELEVRPVLGPGGSPTGSLNPHLPHDPPAGLLVAVVCWDCGSVFREYPGKRCPNCRNSCERFEAFYLGE